MLWALSEVSMAEWPNQIPYTTHCWSNSVVNLGENIILFLYAKKLYWLQIGLDYMYYMAVNQLTPLPILTPFIVISNKTSYNYSVC